MSITYKLNKDKNGVEIKFTEKPSEKVRAKLKELGFRWSQFNGVWYAKQSEETIAYAKELANEEGEQIAFTVEAETEAEAEETKTVSVESIKAERKAKTEKKVQAIKEANKESSKGKKAIDQKPKTESKKESVKTESKTEQKKDNIVIFPTKERPNFKSVVTEGSYTYADCFNKLNEENKEVFKMSFNKAVLDGILAMCKASQNFRNNVMREDKTLLGAMRYFEEMATQGYAYKLDSMVWFDDEFGTVLSVDYFNGADIPENVISKISKEG